MNCYFHFFFFKLIGDTNLVQASPVPELNVSAGAEGADEAAFVASQRGHGAGRPLLATLEAAHSRLAGTPTSTCKQAKTKQKHFLSILYSKENRSNN